MIIYTILSGCIKGTDGASNVIIALWQKPQCNITFIALLFPIEGKTAPVQYPRYSTACGYFEEAHKNTSKYCSAR